jgi:hypothetical protein
MSKKIDPEQARAESIAALDLACAILIANGEDIAKRCMTLLAAPTFDEAFAGVELAANIVNVVRKMIEEEPAENIESLEEVMEKERKSTH